MQPTVGGFRLPPVEQELLGARPFCPRAPPRRGGAFERGTSSSLLLQEIEDTITKL